MITPSTKIRNLTYEVCLQKMNNADKWYWLIGSFAWGIILTSISPYIASLLVNIACILMLLLIWKGVYWRKRVKKLEEI